MERAESHLYNQYSPRTLTKDTMTQLNQDEIPITERQNELTMSIDLTSNFFQDFMHVDQQLFSGYKNYKSVYAFEKELIILASLIRKENVAMSGCGTSGRIAWLCARAWNKFLNEQRQQTEQTESEHKKISYLIAGGDSALIRAEEVAEDDAKATVPSQIQTLIGISCGLSAPYVAGQCRNMIETGRDACILGFNPVELARDRLIFTRDSESKIQTFRDLLQYSADRLLMLNPVVGAEAVTGSTRMKGGSATKFLLDTAFISACNPKARIYDILFEFETAFRYTYHPKNFDKMNNLIHICGESLNQNGHIYYVGYDTAGLLGIVDASECVPTFGATFDDIRGFVVDGWDSMHNNEGNLEARGENFKLNVDHFASSIIPKLTNNDTVIFLYIDAYSDSERQRVSKVFNALSQKMRSSPSQPTILSLIVQQIQPVRDILPEDDLNLRVTIPKLCPDGMQGFPTYGELAMKFLLNAISTGAHILKGTVFTNQMINVRVSNNKLFYRAIGIISRIGKVDKELARKYLLRAIYERDGEQIPFDSDDNEIVEGHIRASVKHSHNVPVAILLAVGYSMGEALQTLRNNPRIRSVILESQ